MKGRGVDWGVGWTGCGTRYIRSSYAKHSCKTTSAFQIYPSVSNELQDNDFMDISLHNALSCAKESNETCASVASSSEEESVVAFVDILEFLSAARKHKMSKSQQDTMVRFFRHRHTLGAAFRANLYFLEKILTPFSIHPTVHHFCVDHQNYIGKASDLSNPIFCKSRVCSFRQTTIESNFKRGAVFFVL